MHLKGGFVVHGIRWSFVAFCFLLFVFSIAILVISSVHYSEMRLSFDELGTRHTYDSSRVFHSFKPEAALAVYYVGISLGVVFALISCVGWCGAACLDRCFLMSFAISLSVVFFICSITLAIITQLYKEGMTRIAAKLYKEFIEHMYGRSDFLLGLISNTIDNMHRRRRCCGAIELKKGEDATIKFGTTLTHYTILYWLESTQWGQIQAKNIDYDALRKLAWAPESCCVNVSDRCSQGIFGDRLDWDETKEAIWSKRIHIRSCIPMLDIGLIDPPERMNLIILAATVMAMMIVMIVLACWLFMTISSYEYSSQDSDMDRPRHRPGRRSRHRHTRGGNVHVALGNVAHDHGKEFDGKKHDVPADHGEGHKVEDHGKNHDVKESQLKHVASVVKKIQHAATDIKAQTVSVDMNVQTSSTSTNAQDVSLVKKTPTAPMKKTDMVRSDKKAHATPMIPVTRKPQTSPAAKILADSMGKVLAATLEKKTSASSIEKNSSTA